MAPQFPITAISQAHDTDGLPTNAATGDQPATEDDKGDHKDGRGLSTLSSLPNELQAEIACHLDTLSLCDLSLASRHWAKIAQDELHRSPWIGLPSHSAKFQRRSRIELLGRTLADRPDLSGRVRILYLGLEHDLVEWATSLYTLDRGIRHDKDVSEALYIGDVLNRIENLQHLDLHMKGEVGWSFPSATNTIVPLRHTGAAKSQNPTTKWTGQTLGVALLASAQRVHIGIGCTLLEPYQSTETCHLPDLIIERFTDLVRLDLPPEEGFKQFFEGLQSLISLTVILCDMSADEYETDVSWYEDQPHSTGGSFDRLIEPLDPVAPILQKLRIAECRHAHDGEHYSCLGYITPISSLAHFEQLHILEVPCEALAGLHQRPLFEVLPASLRCLIVDAPSVAIVPLLESVPVARELWSLQLMQLSTYIEVSFEEFQYRHPNVRRHLEDAGICYDICWARALRRREEWDDDYDPFIGEIVKYLDDLHLSE